ncbi:MAG: VOC family protein [Sphingobacteriaceae bacterium]|nr:MAG: VOC family protein [Sphingobacteriaceae bacterium]
MNKHFSGLRTTIYKVADIAAAKQWYTEAFETSPYFDEPFYVGFNIGGYELGLQPNKAVTGDNVSTYWGTDNVAKQFTRLLTLGATVHEDPQNVGGEIIVATVKDPWGNIIGLIYNPEFKVG